MSGFLAALLLAVAVLGQPALATTLAPAEQCGFVAPTSALDDFAGAACSFSGETEVLLADGMTKPISEIEVGDWVLAEDPAAGERGAREVTHLWVHQDTLIDLEIDGHYVATTADHPFWNEADGEWQRADGLDPGDVLVSADGSRLEIDGIDWASARRETAYNLTVDGIHAYFVGIAGEEVLVHNTCPSGLRGASPGLTSVFDGSSASGRSIIGIRAGLIDDGFTQVLSNNRAGYLFQNSLGEEVQIMFRDGGWDIRIRNQFGNYLDEFRNVADPSATHEIQVLSR